MDDVKQPPAEDTRTTRVTAEEALACMPRGAPASSRTG